MADLVRGRGRQRGRAVEPEIAEKVDEVQI